MINTEVNLKYSVDKYFHRFLDEAGYTTFYGKGKVPIIGNEGVSNYFLIGMLTLNDPIEQVRNKVISLQDEISKDRYFNSVPSILKKKSKSGYFLHAKDDVPEVRKLAFELITKIDCSLEAVIIKKDYQEYEKKHKENQSEFYADLLSHLLVDNFNIYERLVLNIARRGKCTTHKNLEKGLKKALTNASVKYPKSIRFCKITFNVQEPTTEPIINITDYLMWALQRKWEKNENRYVDFLGDKINVIHTV